MNVVVKVTEQEAALLLRRQREGDPATDSSVAAAARHVGATLAPQHPGVADPTLSTYFVATVADRGAAESLVSALLPLPEVDGAYLKPDEEPAMT